MTSERPRQDYAGLRRKIMRAVEGARRVLRGDERRDSAVSQDAPDTTKENPKCRG